jgi:hypothetical protein
MPLYEYTCQNTGLTIELIRSMADADKPVTDAELAAALPAVLPNGSATSAERTNHAFVRKLSTFQPKADAGKRVPLPSPGLGGGCGCGNPNGPCNN